MLKIFRDDGLEHIESNTIYPINIIVLTIDKFDPNPMLSTSTSRAILVHWKYNCKPILVKPSDLVTNEPIQTKELEPLHVELEYFQLVEFEPINNHLAHGNIKRIHVLVNYYNDVPIEDNNVTICNYQNDAFNEHLLTSTS
jgi:hypothetical protein